MLDEIVEFAGRVDRLAVGLGLSLGLGLLAGLGLLDNGSGRGCGLGGELRLEVGDGRVLSLDVGILGFESGFLLVDGLILVSERVFDSVKLLGGN